MKIFINKKYKQRHKILEVLKKNYIENYHPNKFEEELSLTFGELKNGTALSNDDLRAQLSYLINQKEIFSTEENFTSSYFISQLGIVSSDDGKYLNDGKKVINENVKTTGVIISIVISVFSFIISTMKSNDNKDEMKSIKTEIERLKTK